MASFKRTFGTLIFFLFIGKTFLKIIVHPRDTEAVVGLMTYLNCSTSEPSKGISWYYNPFGAQGNIYIYMAEKLQQNYETRARLEIYVDTGAFNLVLPTVQPSDAGKYICQEEGGKQLHSSAQLVVLDTNPVCQSKSKDGVVGPNSCGLEVEDILLFCNATYRGNFPPLIRWEKDGTILDINQKNYSSHVSSAMPIRADLNIDFSHFTCQTTNSAVEQYSCSFKSVKIEIFYALNNFVVTEKKEGEEASCLVNSSQYCTYRWISFDAVGEEIVSSSSNVVLRKSGMYRCEAECSIRNRKCPVMAGLVDVTAMETISLEGLDFEVNHLGIGMLVTGLLLSAMSIFLLYPRLKKLMCLWELQRRGKCFQVRELWSILRGANPTPQALPRLEISGLAMVNDELYICRLHSPDIQVYDSENFRFRRHLWRVQGLLSPTFLDVTNDGGYIFIFDFKEIAQNCEIFRVNTSGELLNKWPTNKWGPIKVTRESRVILTVYYGHEIFEYSQEGQVMRHINMFTAKIFNPWDCIKLSEERYVVCHGRGDDPEHRVCILNVDVTDATAEIQETSRPIRFFGGVRGSSNTSMDVPINLAVDRQGSVYVADQCNSRVLILDSELRYQGELISTKHTLERPQRLLFEESKDRILVIAGSRVAVCRLSSDDKQWFDLDPSSLD